MTIALPTSLHVDHLLPSLCPSEELNGIKPVSYTHLTLPTILRV